MEALAQALAVTHEVLACPVTEIYRDKDAIQIVCDRLAAKSTLPVVWKLIGHGGITSNVLLTPKISCERSDSPRSR